MEVARLGVEWSWSCSSRPTPQPEQREIRAMSTHHTTAQGNAGSLTHWMRPGIKPASSWMLVRFIFSEPGQELLARLILHRTFYLAWADSDIFPFFLLWELHVRWWSSDKLEILYADDCKTLSALFIWTALLRCRAYTVHPVKTYILMVFNVSVDMGNHHHSRLWIFFSNEPQKKLLWSLAFTLNIPNFLPQSLALSNH